MSEGLPAVAQEKGFWDGSGDFDFSKAFGVSEDYAGGRKECGEKLLAKLTEGGEVQSCCCGSFFYCLGVFTIMSVSLAG